MLRRVVCNRVLPVDVQRVAVIGTLSLDVSVGRHGSGRPGLALIVLSVVERRWDAVRSVLAGASVTALNSMSGSGGFATFQRSASTEPPPNEGMRTALPLEVGWPFPDR